MISSNVMKNTSKENKMYIPQLIKDIIQNKPYTLDDIGRSGSTMLIFDDCVLKIQPYTIEIESELEMMKWLENKNIVPKIIRHVVENDKSYLLMTKIEGKMSCDIQYLENNDLLVNLLVEGMKK